MREFPITVRQQGALFWVIRNLVDESDERVSNAGMSPHDRAEEMADVDSLIDLMEVIERTPAEIADLRGRYLDSAIRAEIETELAEAEAAAKDTSGPLTGLFPVVDSDVSGEATTYAYVPSPEAALALARAVFVDKVERIDEIVLDGAPAYLAVTEAAALAALNADEVALIEEARALGYQLFWSMGTAYTAPKGVSVSNNFSGQGWIYGGEALVDAARAALLHAKRTA